MLHDINLTVLHKYYAFPSKWQPPPPQLQYNNLLEQQHAASILVFPLNVPEMHIK